MVLYPKHVFPFNNILSGCHLKFELLCSVSCCHLQCTCHFQHGVGLSKNSLLCDLQIYKYLFVLGQLILEDLMYSMTASHQKLHLSSPTLPLPMHCGKIMSISFSIYTSVESICPSSFFIYSFSLH